MVSGALETMSQRLEWRTTLVDMRVSTMTMILTTDHCNGDIILLSQALIRDLHEVVTLNKLTVSDALVGENIGSVTLQAENFIFFNV